MVMLPSHVLTPEKAGEVARFWLDLHPLFLDTETTGLGVTAEVVDIAILDEDGNVILDTMIHPTRPIPPDAEAVHHISNEMVATMPGMAAVWPMITRILNGRILVAYNADYDTRMLYQSASLAGLTNSINWLALVDSMQLYSSHKGAYDHQRGQYRWNKLAVAAKELSVAGDENLHRALADTEVLRRVFLKMAGKEIDQPMLLGWDDLKEV